MKDGAPTFGLWYDFQQRLPFMGKYEDFYAERPWSEKALLEELVVV